MTDPATVTCPHCSAAAVAGAAFCSHCGLALPSAVPTGPRVVDARGATAATAAGRKLQGDELLATAKRAARSLLSVGIVNLAFAALNVYTMGQFPRLQHSPYFLALTGSQAVGGGIYIGLYFWANVHPLSATIAGLAVYVLKWAVDLGLAAHYHVGSAAGGTVANYQVVRLFMVIYLVRGIGAAVKHRRLEREQAAAGFEVLPVMTPPSDA